MQLIYFSAVPWASFRQRPHEFAQWAHERVGAKVLWVEPYPVRLPVLADLSRPAVTSAQMPTPAWLQLVAPRALPVEPLAAGRWLNRALFWQPVVDSVREFAQRDAHTVLVVGKPSDLALHAMNALQGAKCFYDAMDEFPAFHHGAARRTSEEIESAIVQQCSACSTSSTYLATKLRGRNPNVLLVPNGLASDRMPAAQTDASADAAFGYVGTIGPWFDWAWVAQLASAWPERRIEIHGPLYRKPPAALPANINLHPALPHDKAMEKMTRFAAGLIPFLRTQLTESVDPVKYYEYRALGLPVISTPFGEMRTRDRDPRVVLTDKPAVERARIEQLLDTHDAAESVTAFRAANDWSVRFEPMAALLTDT
ncbi:glycosyl transferase [Caenimonas koreensis]|uniref:glycosyl transferase n=1 Tax=Caenimonas koreensis TaxID=367474 RepID=UPI003783F3E8